MATDSTRDAFFRAVESAGGEVIHNRIHKDERGRFIPEIRLSSPERQRAAAERRQRIIDGMVAEHDRLAMVRAGAGYTQEEINAFTTAGASCPWESA